MSGPSGCGKSSLVRALAGLFVEGGGRVARAADAAFVPQRPFLPTAATLRACVLYPGDGGEDARATAPPPPGDDALAARLREVGLAHLVDGAAGSGAALDEAHDDWASVLSLGEQQRIAWVRVLLRAPRLVVADEATSALDERNEARLYELLRALPGCTVVSVGHRAALARWHTHALACTGEGEWEFRPIRALEAGPYG